MNISLVFLFYLFISATACTNSESNNLAIVQDPPNYIEASKFIIKNINIISLTEDAKIDYSQNLYIENKTIISIDESFNTDTTGVYTIDGTDKYVIPALFDMHTHAIEENDFFLYVANGVTTIRHMWGSQELLDIRARRDNKDFIGPRMFLASAGFEEPPSYWPNTNLIENPDNISNQVLIAKNKGYDFIKVYENISLGNYLKIVEAANEHNIEMIGHLPRSVSLNQVLLENTQKSIAHVDHYLENVAANGTNINSPASYKIDTNKLIEYSNLTSNSEVWNCPTLTITTRHSGQSQELQNDPNLQYVSSRMRNWFTYPNASLNNWDAANYTRHKFELIKSLHDANAKIMLGTDTGLRFILPGFSVHEELSYFVEAGISEIEALKIATKNCAEFLSINQGSIEVDKKAELLILNENPIENISNTRNIHGVLTNGLWLDREYLDKKLEQIKLSNN